MGSRPSIAARCSCSFSTTEHFRESLGYLRIRSVLLCCLAIAFAHLRKHRLTTFKLANFSCLRKSEEILQQLISECEIMSTACSVFLAHRRPGSHPEIKTIPFAFRIARENSGASAMFS